MKISSQFAKSFYSYELNEVKYDLLWNKANLIRTFKNDIAETICQNFYSYVNKSKFELVKEFNTQIVGLTGQDIQVAIGDVYDCFSNKYTQIQKKLVFKIQKKINVFHYKVNTKDHAKGEVRVFTLDMKSTKLTKVMSYLSRYGFEGITEHIKSKGFDDKKQLFYDDVLFYLEKFGEVRLLKLALSKRELIVKRYNNPVVFESLTYRTITRIKRDILNYNKTFDSKINAFVNIGGYKNTKVLQVPVVFSKSYHGNIRDYSHDKNKQNNTSYTVVFDRDKDNHKRVRFVISLDDDRIIPENNLDFLGIDVNVKHNLFALPNDVTIDYDRKFIDDYVKFLNYLDKKKETKFKLGLSKEEISTLSKKDKYIYDKIQSKLLDMLKRKINLLVKFAIKNNKNHLVFEDLKLFSKSFAKNEEFSGINYGRLSKLLHLNDLKNLVLSIAHKHGLSVSIVQPEFTSQECPDCHYIDKLNRKTQEVFKCMQCSYEANADSNSAVNIENRVQQDVLAGETLTRNNVGEFRPKKFSHKRLKEIILSYSYNLQKKDRC